MDAFFETFKDIFDKASDFVSFILKLPSFISEYLKIFPTEITNLLIPVLVIVVAIFVYRFVR